jgi:chemotaxis protein MotB
MEKVIGVASLMLLVFSSCIGKKKHLELISQLEATYTSDLSSKQATINELEKVEFDLRLDLAERKGENNILNVLRKELEGKIEELENQIENLSVNANDQENQLKQKVVALQKEIASLERKLSSIGMIIEGFNKEVDEVYARFGQLQQDGIMIEKLTNGLQVSISEELIFKQGLTDFSSKAPGIMDSIAEILEPFLRFEVAVSVHTDTDKPNRKFADNWEFTMLRASRIVSFLTEESGFSPNRISGSGKSAYYPKSSNSTPEGKKSNRRIEFLVRPSESFLIREIRLLLN